MGESYLAIAACITARPDSREGKLGLLQFGQKRATLYLAYLLGRGESALRNYLGLMTNLVFDNSNGELILRTGVAGSASRMGHRLVIEIGQWSAVVTLDEGRVSNIFLEAALASLHVRSGEGGVKPLSEGDRATIASNARRALDAAKYPNVLLECRDSFETPSGPGRFPLRGTLEIHGHKQPIETILIVTDAGSTWKVEASVQVRQTDFGVRPYSTMLGQLRVADEVSVEFTASVTK